MERNAYRLANSKVGVLDGKVRLGNDLLSLDEGRNLVQSFLGERPKYAEDIALKLNEAKGYFKQVLESYHKKRN